MRLSGIFLYPVKGMRGIALPESDIEPCGLAGDRRWMVVDPEGRFLTQRRHPALARFDAHPEADGGLRLGFAGEPFSVDPPDARSARLEVSIWYDRFSASCAGPRAASWLSERLGLPCRLVYQHEPTLRPVESGFALAGEHVSFADGFPILLASHASLASLNDALGDPVGMDRFRPNLVVDGAEPWQEDHWRRLRIGTLPLRAAKTCVRCIVTSIDQQSGTIPRKGQPLRALASLNRKPEGLVFGSNLVPLESGRVCLGDEVLVLDG